MNFFKLYIGDYQRDTAHLSVTEHGAFMLMLQHYYATEKPLPAGKALHRMLRAQDKAERDAIDSVVTQFWRLTDAGLVNDRADEEITKAGAQADTNARIAREREAARRAARKQHEQSTNRATNDQPNQTPDTNTPHSPPDGGQVPCPYNDIVNAYHLRLPGLPKVKLMADSRQKALRKFWGWVLSSKKSDGLRRAETGEQALEWIDAYFARAAENDFLMGRTPRSDEHRGWTCDLDFLLTERGRKHVIERTEAAA